VTRRGRPRAGQLELNVMMPVIAHNLLFSMMILTNATRVASGALRSTESKRMRHRAAQLGFERSPALVTAPRAKNRLRRGRETGEGSRRKENVTVRQLVIEKGLLKGKELERGARFWRANDGAGCAGRAGARRNDSHIGDPRMNSWIVAGLIAGVVVYLVDWGPSGARCSIPQGVAAMGGHMSPEEMKELHGPRTGEVGGPWSLVYGVPVRLGSTVQFPRAALWVQGGGVFCGNGIRQPYCGSPLCSRGCWAAACGTFKVKSLQMATCWAWLISHERGLVSWWVFLMK